MKKPTVNFFKVVNNPLADFIQASFKIIIHLFETNPILAMMMINLIFQVASAAAGQKFFTDSDGAKYGLDFDESDCATSAAKVIKDGVCSLQTGNTFEGGVSQKTWSCLDYIGKVSVPSVIELYTKGQANPDIVACIISEINKAFHHASKENKESLYISFGCIVGAAILIIIGCCVWKCRNNNKSEENQALIKPPQT